MSLRDVDIRSKYRSDKDSILKDFYIPCLSKSCLYRRAVGYFRASSLVDAARGISALVEKNDGRIQLVASPALDEKDHEAIRMGLDLKNLKDKTIKNACNSFDRLEDKLQINWLDSLALLVESGRLEIKIAYPIDPISGQLRDGIYHEKIGILTDKDDHNVAFMGTANETRSGYSCNFETILTFRDWLDESQSNKDICKGYVEDFENLWNNNTPKLQVEDFSDVADEIFKKYRVSDGATDAVKREVKLEEEAGLFPENDKIALPDWLAPPLGSGLRDYQKQAIANWKKNAKTNERGGIIKLATGTGKTITALSLVKDLAERGLNSVVIAVPYRNLVDQWAEQAREFNVRNILKAYEGRGNWIEQMNLWCQIERAEEEQLRVIITTFATLQTPAFQNLIQTQWSNYNSASLLIADEMHHLGAASAMEKMPTDAFDLKLGLSATPERYLDDDGTADLVNYFGKIVEPKITVADAIAMDPPCLCEYEYHTHIVELTFEEEERFRDLTKRIAMHHGSSQHAQLKAAIGERSRLIATAHNKLDCLMDIIKEIGEISHTLIYSGAGTIEDPLDDEMDFSDDYYIKQIDGVVKILGEYNNNALRVDKYVAETPAVDRARLLSELNNGRLNALVAINCLDEGIDVKSIQTAIIMASSSNPRQFIQRRGRILRLHENKEVAKIYDMIVIPQTDDGLEKAEINLIRKELKRYFEFAIDAKNAEDAISKLNRIKERYGL